MFAGGFMISPLGMYPFENYSTMKSATQHLLMKGKSMKPHAETFEIQ